MMNTDIHYKKEVHRDAIVLLRQEYENKKAGSREENKKIKNFLSEITEDSNSSEIKWKCKELALEDFLRKEIKSQTDIDRLIKKVFEREYK